MSDDFMSDINDAVNGTASVETTVDPITSVVTDDAKSDRETIESQVAALVSDEPEEPKTRKTLTVKKSEPTAEETKEAEAKGEAKKTETTPTKETQEIKDGKKVPYLDRYLKEDNTGNLILADGTVVASTGVSRTFYEGIKREGREARESAQALALSNVQLANKFKELYGKFEELTAKKSSSNDLTQTTGMNEEEISGAVSLMKQYKTDPLSAIKSLLTQARMRGIDLSSIGVDGGFDPAVVQKAIADAVRQATVKDETTVVTKAPPSREQAIEEATNFLTRYPAAAEHSDLIAKAKDRFPDMTLDEIWINLQAHLQNQMAKADEEAFNASQASTTQPPITPATRVVKAPQNYENLTFEQIARTIKEDFK